MPRRFPIERFNLTMRQRVSRLVMMSLSFSKKLENHIGAIWYFIHHHNFSITQTISSSPQNGTTNFLCAHRTFNTQIESLNCRLRHEVASLHINTISYTKSKTMWEVSLKLLIYKLNNPTIITLIVTVHIADQGISEAQGLRENMLYYHR